MSNRTPKQIKLEVKELIRALRTSGIDTGVRKSFRFYVTPDEADAIKNENDSRATVSSGTRDSDGYYLAFFGVRLVTQAGLYCVY